MNRTKTTILLLIVAIFTISIFCQSAMFISWDVGWRLHLTQLFLAGGNYVTDFIDINPPVLLYEFIPAVLLTKLTGLSAIVSLRILIYILITASLWLCYKIHKKLFIEKSPLIKIGFMTAITIILLLTPALEFGQQEHWILILTLPYFLNASLFVIHQKTTKSLQFWVGLFAAFGFITNILYLFIFIAVECFLAIRQQSIKTLFRTEAIIISAVTILYIVSIFIFTPNYMHVMLPLSFSLFFAETRFSWLALINNSTSLTCLLTILFFPFHYKHSSYRPLYIVLLIALIGFYASFLLTHKTWYFHLIPTLGTASLMLSLYFIEDIKQIQYLSKINIKTEILFLTATILMFFIILIFPLRDIYIYNRNAIAYRQFKTNEINLMINYIKRVAEGKTIYVFSLTPNPAITLMDYANVKLANKMSGFWMLPGILTLSSKQQKHAEQLLFERVIKSFKESKPALVIVEKSDRNKPGSSNRFSYIQYFSQDPRFKKIWAQYHFVYQINDFSIYARKEGSHTS